MSDELSQLDELTESDILAALGQEVSLEEETIPTESENINIDSEFLNETEDGEVTNIPDGLLEKEDDESLLDEEDSENIEELTSAGEELEDVGDIEILPIAEIESALEEQEEEQISINSQDIGSLADILSKLLNNKTIEITIKVKD